MDGNWELGESESDLTLWNMWTGGAKERNIGDRAAILLQRCVCGKEAAEWRRTKRSKECTYLCG